ncbi:nicotinate-nucleotide--dimethylbenzimidazole phosphoribosyltransferase [Aquincola sp. S2]|uniref:Nicotinate-nucleotide--dimethylbenzimidazole phosphoribosyltransferase n=1 Tax=Pseudaquabacterium terrae TaxID=2732868 RepID=A0ABX2EPB0_9BURK|nr:nicotinate-nucleotide--dimethylbenzimidazole phosphoribosyltransferase [Aquabacterium terrae]NRF70463.1 nicotinate-nucleotide--dimethylbenzimidazole phosphoribosyltransferase [Aquabacterium terrae]
MSTLPTIADLHDVALDARLHQIIDQKTKPLGALGRLETLGHRLGMILGTEAPRLRDPQLIVFAADHGLAARGVSAYPSDVTWQMVENFLAGGAAVSVLARQHGLALSVVDVGVRHAFAPRAGFVDAKVAEGTADATRGPAMTPAQCAQAIDAGRRVVAERPGNVLLPGEMGIGNTSAASLLTARLLQAPLAACLGRGTGLDDAGLQHKRAVLSDALEQHGAARTPLDVLARLGGLEIAALVGAMLQAAAERRVIVIDGFICSAALLVAAQLAPAVLQRCVFAHCSTEPGHRLLLDHFGAQPLLDLGLRLGEGSGAALAWPLLDSACRIVCEMASFDSAGVSRSS